MTPRTGPTNFAVKQSKIARSNSRSPARIGLKKDPRPHYGSQGVKDNDIFLLPGSDYQLLLLLTAIAAGVRLFRIYQPSSVVFDEVQ